MTAPYSNPNINKCFRKKYYLFGERQLRHKYDIERIWQIGPDDIDFSFSAICKRCGEKQLWNKISEDFLIEAFGVDILTLHDVRATFPNCYFNQVPKQLTP